MSTDHPDRPADVQAADAPPVARLIPESAHPIREQQLDREALKVLYRLRDAGFKGYLVGGGVRDLYLGRAPKDFDISTDARPGQLRQLFRNSRTIGRRFRLVQVFFRGNKIIEVNQGDTVTITVAPVNDAPVASDDAASGNEDSLISGNVLANDTDIDTAALTAALVTGLLAEVAALYDTSARQPEPLLLPYTVRCTRAEVDHAELSSVLRPPPGGLQISLQ